MQSRSRQRPLTLREQWQVQWLARKYIDPRRFFGWLLGLALPFVVAMSFLIGWHNQIVGEVEPIHLAARAVVMSIGLYGIIVVVYYKALRPALRRARAEVEAHQSEPADTPQSDY